MSSKNDLQEYFQKRKKNLPKYKTIKKCGPAHEPLWVSTVELCDGRTYESEELGGKKVAEMDAASKAYSDILENGLSDDFSRGIFNFTDRSILILVDVENKPTFLDYFSVNVDTTGVEVLGFVSNGSSLHQKIKNSGVLNDKRISLIAVPSSRPDGADIGMTFFAGFAIGNIYSTNTYLILSEDHFAEALADCIRDYRKILTIKASPLNPKKMQCVVCRNANEVCEKLESMCIFGHFDE